MADFNILVGVQSGDAIQKLANVEKSVKRVGTATNATNAQLKAHARQYNNTAVAANKFGKGVAQQAGYQVADFAVQLQNGTSFLQAFGQQGSQMLAIFGPLGAVLGAVVAVGAALGTVISKSTDKVSIFNNANTNAKSALKAIREETEKYNNELELLQSGLDTAAQLQLQKAIVSLKEAIAQKEVRLQEEQTQKGRNNTSREVKASMDLLVQQLGVLYAEDEANRRALEALKKKNAEIRASKKAVRETTIAYKSGLNPQLKQLEQIAESVGSTFESSFMNVVKGTASVKDAFRSMAADIIAELYRVFVVKKITGFISGLVMDIGGMPMQGPNLPTRAVGGPVSAGQPYLVGERGPELMIPSSNGKIIPNNQLGGGQVVVNQTINVSTGVQQTVRTEIKSLMPQIAESAKAAVADAKRRGGSYGRAFA